ncbi:MAG: S-layer homology domain-containing protein, partial [Clostridiales bacterium]|nr:S-layer homology domain-containing protein [Clostridiales bacterium]
NLGLDPTPITPFVDDSNIVDWAKQEIYAANRIGLISSGTDGRIRPLDSISKAEGAALINRLIDYMRVDMQKDYTENIVNFAD